jgi:hypothetical protein
MSFADGCEEADEDISVPSMTQSMFGGGALQQMVMKTQEEEDDVDFEDDFKATTVKSSANRYQ